MSSAQSKYLYIFSDQHIIHVEWVYKKWRDYVDVISLSLRLEIFFAYTWTRRLAQTWFSNESDRVALVGCGAKPTHGLHYARSLLDKPTDSLRSYELGFDTYLSVRFSVPYLTPELRGCQDGKVYANSANRNIYISKTGKIIRESKKRKLSINLSR